MDQQLFELSVKAILKTARQAFFEGYNRAETRGDPCEEYEWEQSDTKAECDKMIAALTEKKDAK